MRFSLEGEKFLLGPGDFCLDQQGKRFAYENEGSSQASLVLMHFPSFDLESEVFTSDSQERDSQVPVSDVRVPVSDPVGSKPVVFPMVPQPSGNFRNFPF